MTRIATLSDGDWDPDHESGWWQAIPLSTAVEAGAYCELVALRSPAGEVHAYSLGEQGWRYEVTVFASAPPESGGAEA